MKKVHALQDAIKVEQPGGPGRFEVPNWDQASQKTVRDALREDSRCRVLSCARFAQGASPIAATDDYWQAI